MSIHHQTAKIKSFLDSPKGHDFMVILVLLGVSVSAFSLGISSAKNDSEADSSASKVIIKTNPNLIVATAEDYVAGTAKNNAQVANSLSASLATKPNDSSTQNATKNSSANATNSEQKNISNNNSNLPFVASSRGKKYYPIGCSAVKTLSQTNLVYFKDQAEAEAKGYSLSTSCK